MQKRFETEVRREQITEAALSIISNEGVNGLTVRKVAQRVGFSAPALYRHYKSKSDILLAVLDDHFSMFFSLIKKAKQNAHPLEALKEFYFNYINLIRDGRSAFPIFISEHVRFKDAQLLNTIDECHNTIHEQLIEVIEEGQSQKIIRHDIGSEELFIHYIGLLIVPDLLNSQKRHYLDLTKQAEANWRLFSKAVSN